MISAVILAKNEKKNLLSCIRTLDWCDEIIVIDDYSSDDSVAALKKKYVKNLYIFEHNLNKDFSTQRNFGLSKAAGDWVLFIDADERVSGSLQYEIINVINTSINNTKGYYIPRRDIMWGKLLRFGESGQVKLLRLARKGAGEWEGKVHEIWKISGKKGELKNALIHYPHQNVTEFLREINFYTDLRANELYLNNKKTNVIEIVIYPSLKFFINYILRFGFMDGTHGLLVSALMGFHSFLVRAKLWRLWEEKGR